MVVFPPLAARTAGAAAINAAKMVLRMVPFIVPDSVLAAAAAGSAKLGRNRHPVGTERLLGACAPERRRFDWVPVGAHLLLGVRVGVGVHALVAQLGAVDGSDVTRGQWIHTQFTRIPAAFMMARFTAVRAICTL